MSMFIESFVGPVTISELNEFTNYIMTLKPAENNIDNNYAQGKSGEEIKAMGIIIEIIQCQLRNGNNHNFKEKLTSTHKKLLNYMIVYCEKIISIRNDIADTPIGQNNIWIPDNNLGEIAPVWPNNTKDNPVTEIGSEQSNIAGHLAYCARLIAETESIDMNLVDIEHKNIAEKFIETAEFTLSEYIIKYLYDYSRYQLYFSPPLPQNGGKPIPWNQQMMYFYLFSNLSKFYKMKRKNKDKITYYDLIINNGIKWFFDEIEPIRSLSGTDTYNWKYASGRTVSEDSNHANLDIDGLYRMYIEYYSVSLSQMKILANTFTDTMIIGDEMYAGRVDGSSDEGKGAMTTTIRPAFILLSEFRKDYLSWISGTDIILNKTTTNYQRISRFLWIKNRVYNNLSC